MKLNLSLYILFLLLFSCEKKEVEFVGLWVEDFETSYIKLTEKKYYFKFNYLDKSREIFGHIVHYDTLTNILEVKYNKIFDDKEELENVNKEDVVYFRYKIEDKILYYSVSADKNNKDKLEGFYIKEPYE